MSFEVGQKRSRKESYETEEVQKFAELSGDENPIHIDPDYVDEESHFDNPIVHGVFVLGTVSDLLTEFDGEIVLVNISSTFVEPVYHGEEHTVTCTIDEVSGGGTKASVGFSVENENGVEKLWGTAEIIDYSE